MKKLQFIILVGLPCSGKSTFRKKYLANNPNTKVISYDDIILAHDNASYNSNYIHINHKQAEKDMKSIMLDAIKEKKSNILIDKMNLTKKSRNRLLSSVDKKVYNIVCYVFKIDKPTFLERNKNRNILEDKFISETLFDEFNSILEYPDLSENIDTIFYE